jgi:hypothetical protein
MEMKLILLLVVALGLLLLYYQQTQAKIITFKSGVTLDTNGSFSEQVGKLAVGNNLSLLEAGITKAGNVVDTYIPESIHRQKQQADYHHYISFSWKTTTQAAHAALTAN